MASQQTGSIQTVNVFILTVVVLFSVSAYAVITPVGVQTVTDTTLATMLMTLQESLVQIWDFLMRACWLFGIIIFTLGMLKLKKYGQMTVFMMAQADMVGPMLRILVGTLLMYIPWAIDMMLATVWGGSTSRDTVQGYTSTGGTNYEDFMGPVFTIVQIIGLVAFMRGLLTITKAGEQGGQPGNVPRGLMLLFGGVLCINIDGTIKAVMATFGIT